MQLGELRLTLVSDGEFRLDGGAMFGVVPKTLWERQKPADEKNRIRMATNCLLVESGRDLVLIDTGIGDKNDAKFQTIYGLDPHAERLPASIQRAGYELGDVTAVVLTHLHFDHCGWNTRQGGNGLVPTFPEARYFLNRGEVGHARHPNPRDTASYDPRNWEPLFAAGVVELFDEQIEPAPGLRAIKAPGHNADLCIVQLDGGSPETQGVFLADLVPTVAHVPVPWVMGYDLYPVLSLESKSRWLAQMVAGRWLGVFEHDADTPWARVVEEAPGRYRGEVLTDPG